MMMCMKWCYQKIKIQWALVVCFMFQTKHKFVSKFIGFYFSWFGDSSVSIIQNFVTFIYIFADSIYFNQKLLTPKSLSLISYNSAQTTDQSKNRNMFQDNFTESTHFHSMKIKIDDVVSLYRSFWCGKFKYSYTLQDSEHDEFYGFFWRTSMNQIFYQIIVLNYLIWLVFVLFMLNVVQFIVLCCFHSSVCYLHNHKVTIDNSQCNTVCMVQFRFSS